MKLKINFGEIIAVLIEAFKVQQKMIEDLQVQINQMKNK